MYNIWFAIEDRAWANSLKKTDFGPDVNPTWFPATGDSQRPFPYLLDAIQRSSIDLLFYQSYRQPFPGLSVMRQVPTLVSLDGAPLRPFVREPRRSSSQAFMALLRKLGRDEKLTGQARQAAGFVVWSEWARQELSHNFGVNPGNILVARTGVDLGDWDADQQDFQIASRPARTLPERVRLLFAAEDFEQMGGGQFVKVFNQDSALADLCELHLITRRSSAAGYLEKLVANPKLSLHLHPFDAPADIYLNSDIFVLPAPNPGSPSQLATALAAGLPIVTTQVAGLTELVQDGQNGLVVPANDVAALSRAIHTLVDDPALRYELGLAGRRLAEQQFQATQTGQQLISFARKLLAQPRPNKAAQKANSKQVATLLA